MQNYISEIMRIRPNPRRQASGVSAPQNAVVELNAQGFTSTPAPGPESNSWSAQQARRKAGAAKPMSGSDGSSSYVLADGTVYKGDVTDQQGYLTRGGFVSGAGGPPTASQAVGQPSGGPSADAELDGKVQAILGEYNKRLEAGVDPAAAAGVAGIPLTDANGRPVNFRLLAQDPRQLKQLLARGMYGKTDGRNNR